MRKALLFIFATALISGCNLVYRQPVFQGNLLDKQNVDQLKQGMTQEQVIALLGTPPLADPFHQERWDYLATERHKRNPIQVKNLTLWFDGNALNKWEGEYFPEQDSALVVEMRKFGNLPKDKDKDKKGSH